MFSQKIKPLLEILFLLCMGVNCMASELIINIPDTLHQWQVFLYNEKLEHVEQGQDDKTPNLLRFKNLKRGNYTIKVHPVTVSSFAGETHYVKKINVDEDYVSTTLDYSPVLVGFTWKIENIELPNLLSDSNMIVMRLESNPLSLNYEKDICRYIFLKSENGEWVSVQYSILPGDYIASIIGKSSRDASLFSLISVPVKIEKRTTLQMVSSFGKGAER